MGNGTGHSLSKYFDTVFPEIVNRLLKHEPKIIHDTFNLQDMCLLLSGKDAHELKTRLLRRVYMEPMDIFLSGLVTFPTSSSTRDSTDTMVLYLQSCPHDFLHSAIQRLAARIKMRPLVSSSDLDPDDEYKDLRHYLESLPGIIEFTILLIGSSDTVRREIFSIGVGEHIVEVSQACLGGIDMYSAHEVEVLLPLCRAFHRALVQLRVFFVQDTGIELCQQKVFSAFIRTTSKWPLLKSTHKTFHHLLYHQISDLLSSRYVSLRIFQFISCSNIYTVGS